MSDLAEFIEARLREDEQAARAATPGPWRYDPTKMHVEPETGLRSEGVFTGPDGPDAICVATTGDVDDVPSMKDARYIARHDPEREFAEVALKRLILREHRSVGERTVWLDSESRWAVTEVCEGCSEWEDREENHYVPWPCDYITALQAIYPEENQ